MKYFAAILFLGFVVVTPVIVGAQAVVTPTPATQAVTPGGFVNDIYNVALLVGGILAFGAIVYGAIMYSLAGGNSNLAHEAQDQITQAVIGLLLLFGAYMVLNLVNPELVDLTLPKIERLELKPNENLGPLGECVGGCQFIPIPCKSGASCTADRRVVDKLRCVTQLRKENYSGPDFRVTEAMPPTVPHDDARHNTGCAIDVALVTPPVAGKCFDVEKLRSLFQICGLSVLNEYQQCDGALSEKATGGHFHVTGC